MERRTFLATIGMGAATAAVAPKLAFAAPQAAFGGPRFAAAIAAAERRSGGRLGVAVLDLAHGARFAHRGDERFAMCSTFKFPLTGAVLAAVDAGTLRLDAAIPVRRSDIIAHAPVTRRHVGGTMTVEALCAAAMTVSDGTAANLLVAAIGGVDRYTAFLRRLGDPVTRLDRKEPDLAQAAPGDPRDTTTPDAMLGTMRALLVGNRLSQPSRSRLTRWMVANTTGDTRLRAGVPGGWRVGDKTGTGGHGTYNDIGILWPAPRRAPILVASYLTGATVAQDRAHAVHADVARAIAAVVA